MGEAFLELLCSQVINIPTVDNLDFVLITHKKIRSDTSGFR